MAGQSSGMTINEVGKTIKNLEHNTQTMGNNGSCSGAETNQQVSRTNTIQPKKAK